MRRLLLSCGLLIAAVAGSPHSDVQASIYTFTGSGANLGNTATADFTYNSLLDTVTIVLTNTTTTTLDAGDLFTGVRFWFGGLGANLASDLGIQRTVASTGSFTDTGGAVNLSWSIKSPTPPGGPYELNFNPDAKDAIIGPPTSGSYSNANNSIKANNGHNPFVAQTATFVLSVPGLLDTTPLTVNAFLFGTGPSVATGTITTPTPDPDPDGEPAVPEPTSLAVFSVLAMAGTLGYWRQAKA